MPSRTIPERRRSKRTAERKLASLIVKHGRQAQRIPCVILDSSERGYKIGGASRLKRGQLVDLILEEDTSYTLQCRVMWVEPVRSREEKRGSESRSKVPE